MSYQKEKRTATVSEMAIGIRKTLLHISFNSIDDFILGEYMLKGDWCDKQKSVPETKLAYWQDVEISNISKAFNLFK